MAFKNILLIDDDEDDHDIFRSALNQLSDNVSFDAILDANDALKRLISKQLEPDVIFLDLNMPKMNGEVFLTLIKNDNSLKNIPVIIYSTASSPSTIRTVKELGASDYITKPDSFEGLLHIMKPLVA
ncbi:response regulator [Dyadobacter chenwenxiniae]|uniref:Response regulator n=1 Tax=Dyadobacter chenwenxiniae TaxID=2906456 RepID=A0A9X1PPV5_9BACT|nr:response regulator [Dyadobacter chenwenxiniae]MCF0065205.1 response regulator [Dyadobacter chenwenxiniae]UON84525.1 response regulator [Dyadobacter chenwenxiniae]